MAKPYWRRSLAYARLARDLRRQNRTRAFDDFLRDLFATEPRLPARAFTGMIPRSLDAAAEMFVKQWTARLVFVPEDIRYQLLRGFAEETAKPLAIALPPHLLTKLRGMDWPLDEVGSAEGFRSIVRDAFRQGLRRAVRLTIEAVKSSLAGRRKTEGRHATLHNMYPHTVPQLTHDGPEAERWDFVSWIRRSGLLPQDTKIWAQSVDAPISAAQAEAAAIETTVLPWPFSPPPGRFLLFLPWALALIAVAGWGYLNGRWWKAVALTAAIETAYVRILGRNRLPDVFVFTNTVQAVRPLWTYQAETMGAEILMVQYSHNHQDDFDVSAPARVLTSPTLVAGNTWPHIAVWTEEMASQGFNALATQSRFTVTGPVGFGDRGDVPEQAPDKPVAVIFDLVPIQPALLYKRPEMSCFQQEETVLAYLEDVFSAACEAGFRVLFKPKSYFGLYPGAPPSLWPKMTRRYRDLMDRYDCLLAPYGVSVMRIASKSDVCVGFPFTSSASAGHLLGVPSAYYDPTETLSEFEPLGQGCPLVMGRDNLAKWFDEQARALNNPPRGQVRQA